MIPVDIALAAAQRMARDGSVALEHPDHPLREAILLGLAAAHAVTGKGWDLGYAREHISITLPGASDGIELLAAVPYVGGLLRDICRDLERPTVWLSPAAMADGAGLLGVVRHELGHVGQLRVGSLPWCVAYGVIGEVRAAAEGACYVADLAARTVLGGASVDATEAGLVGALRGYGLGDDEATAAEMIRSAAFSVRRGGDPGGVIEDIRRALRAEGWAT